MIILSVCICFPMFHYWFWLDIAIGVFGVFYAVELLQEFVLSS